MTKRGQDHPGTRLKEAIKALKIDRKLLAEKMGIKYNTLAHYISGFRQLNEGHAYIISRHYPINPEWLLHNQGKPYVEISQNLVSEPEIKYRQLPPNRKELMVSELSTVLMDLQERVMYLEVKLAEIAKNPSSPIGVKD